jgi:hypothetical protein
LSFLNLKFEFIERKLERIKKKNEKVTGKDLIASMTEYKEIYMRNAFKNNIDLNTDYSTQVIDTTYLQVIRIDLFKLIFFYKSINLSEELHQFKR